MARARRPGAATLLAEFGRVFSTDKTAALQLRRNSLADTRYLTQL